MRRFRYVFAIAFTGLVAFAVFLTLLGFDVLGGPQARVQDVPPGHQEIALLLPATEVETWERLIAAVDKLQEEWPTLDRQPNRLHVNKKRAFLDRAADVPEVSVGLGEKGSPRLWIRWYKLSSETDWDGWLEKLRQRQTPPLAILGGEQSLSANRLVKAMQNHRQKWRGQAPLLLLTTATADYYQSDAPDMLETLHEEPAKQQPLIEVYAQRSFRFSFTNSRMAYAVLDFVDKAPELWPVPYSGSRNVAVLAGCVGAGQGWGILGTPVALGHLRSYLLHTVEWSDNSYSVDLSARFQQEFQKRLHGDPGDTIPYLIAYSSGDYFQPNPPERREVFEFLKVNARHRNQRQLLALPTSAERAQRWLNAVVRQLTPTPRRHLVVISGDSISFNSIYRDRNSTWNPYDLPVSLVTFCHRNPIDAHLGFRPQAADGEPSQDNTATDELLLHRDIVESLVLAAHRDGRLLTDTEAILARFRQLTWSKQRIDLKPEGKPLFSANGERHVATGEHIVWLRPEMKTGPRTQPPVITTWYSHQNAWRKGAQELPLWPQTWGPLSKS